jgi:hypothetical protein
MSPDFRKELESVEQWHPNSALTGKMEYGLRYSLMNGAVNLSKRRKKMNQTKSSKQPQYRRYFSVRLDSATTKKLMKLVKGRKSQNQVFIDAVNRMYDVETAAFLNND